MRIAVALLGTCLLCACGQKGALYLPGEEREEVTPVNPVSTEAAAATDEEREREAAARTTRTN